MIMMALSYLCGRSRDAIFSDTSAHASSRRTAVHFCSARGPPKEDDYGCGVSARY